MVHKLHKNKHSLYKYVSACCAQKINLFNEEEKLKEIKVHMKGCLCAQRLHAGKETLEQSPQVLMTTFVWVQGGL